ncbi:MAG: Sensory transduction protein regX3 [bacterium ADurb.Bin243]|nr:MAG: Sensory transduction protein regX3 [bacterium ADurb.Bin243]HOD41347.1 response regulator transcription factor [Candidatus Wallbacteria bacterium]
MINNKYKILIIDDDDLLSDGLIRVFEAEGWQARRVCSLNEAAACLGDNFISAYNFDVIILDIVLPDGLGFDLLKSMRAFAVNVPVIVLSSQNKETDRVAGLELGADDYVSKPFSLLELKSRIKAVVKRYVNNRGASNKKPLKKFKFKKLEVDFESGKIVSNGRKNQLSYTELALFKTLVMNPGRVIAGEELIDIVWKNNIIESNGLPPHISRLRKKIAPYETLIVNISKIGYTINFEAVETSS